MCQAQARHRTPDRREPKFELRQPGQLQCQLEVNPLLDKEPTADLGGSRSFEERVFARFDAMDARFAAIEARFDSVDARLDSMDARLTGLEGRMSSVEDRLFRLEDKVERRLQETRPIWEAVQEQLERLSAKLDIVLRDIYEIRADVSRLDRRVTSLEHP